MRQSIMVPDKRRGTRNCHLILLASGGYRYKWGYLMPRVPSNLVRSAVQFFDSEEAAKAESGWGGAGFLLGIGADVDGPAAMVHVFLVTARHVVGTVNATHWIRRVDANNNVHVDRIEWGNWHFHPDGDDIAICPLDFVPYWPGDKYQYVDDEQIVPKPGYSHYSVGTGDDVFTIGRLLRKDGRQQKVSHLCVRFGSVAAHEPKPIYNSFIQANQESILVEMFSISGMSGAPVFVYRPPGSLIPGVPEAQHTFSGQTPKGTGPWLLGINWGHLNTIVPAKLRDSFGESSDVELTLSSHIAQVIPAQKILDVLNQTEVEQMIKSVEDDYTEKLNEHEAQDGAALLDSPQKEAPGLTRDEFFWALRRVSRPLGENSQDQPAQESSGTLGDQPSGD